MNDAQKEKNVPLLFLKTAVNLENMIYTHDQLINKLKAQSASLGRRKRISMPSDVSIHDGESEWCMRFFTVGLVLSWLLISTILTARKHLFDWLWAEIKSIFFAILIACIASIIGYFIKRSLNRRKEKNLNLESTMDAIAALESDKKELQRKQK